MFPARPRKSVTLPRCSGEIAGVTNGIDSHEGVVDREQNKETPTRIQAKTGMNARNLPLDRCLTNTLDVSSLETASLRA